MAPRALGAVMAVLGTTGLAIVGAAGATAVGASPPGSSAAAKAHALPSVAGGAAVRPNTAPSKFVTVTDPPGNVYYVNKVSGRPTPTTPATPTHAPAADLIYASAKNTATTLTFTAKTTQTTKTAGFTPTKTVNWVKDDTYIAWQIDSTFSGRPDYVVFFQLTTTGALDGELADATTDIPDSCTVTLSYSHTTGYEASFAAACLGNAKSFQWNVFSNYDWHSTDTTGRKAIGKALPDTFRNPGETWAPPVVGRQFAAGGPGAPGYWLFARDGGVFSFGNASFHGSKGGQHLNKPVVGGASTSDGEGYWMDASDGGIFSFGDATFYGSMGSSHLNQPVVGMAATPTGAGYWLVASDGGIFSFNTGIPGFYGSMGGHHLNQPIVGMASTPDGKGYWLVAADGGIFSFGDAKFYGSTGSMHLNAPIVGMASTPDGGGYWLVAADGGIFSFGDAVFHGSTGSMHLNAPIVGMAATPTGKGYWLAASDGGVFAFGATFYGSMGGTPLNQPITGMAAS